MHARASTDNNGQTSYFVNKKIILKHIKILGRLCLYRYVHYYSYNKDQDTLH